MCCRFLALRSEPGSVSCAVQGERLSLTIAALCFAWLGRVDALDVLTLAERSERRVNALVQRLKEHSSLSPSPVPPSISPLSAPFPVRPRQPSRRLLARALASESDIVT